MNGVYSEFSIFSYMQNVVCTIFISNILTFHKLEIESAQLLETIHRTSKTSLLILSLRADQTLRIKTWALHTLTILIIYSIK